MRKHTNENAGTLRHQGLSEEAWTRGWADQGRVGEGPVRPAQILLPGSGRNRMVTKSCSRQRA